MRLLIFIFITIFLISCNSANELEFEIYVNSIEYITFSDYSNVSKYSVNVQLNEEFTKKLGILQK